MKIFEYLHDKLLIIICQLCGIMVVSLYLLALDNQIVTIVIIIFIWITGLVMYLMLDYQKRNRYFTTIKERLQQLEKPYIIHEFIEETWRYEDKLYKEIMHQANKSALEAIAQLEEEQNEYKSFIEAWIHEVKLPMTSIYLVSAELENKHARKIESYLADLENQVDQALFYARSDHVYQDYLIKEVSLEKVISDLLKKNIYLLIQNQMSINMNCDDNVYTDSKWLHFIINQIIFNAVKYKKVGEGSLSFSSIDSKENTKLIIKDTGIGIRDNELPRVFDKGFTGTNGRNTGKSTGFGLYLSKKLCLKLGLAIQIDSKENEYTELTILFPKK